MEVRSASRVGDLIMVVGMVGRDESGAVIPGVLPQTKRAFERVEEVLREHDCDLDDLVRLRVYLTDIADWPAVRDEITRILDGPWPPAIAVAVSALVEPSMKVEIEVDAIAK